MPFFGSKIVKSKKKMEAAGVVRVVLQMGRNFRTILIMIVLKVQLAPSAAATIWQKIGPFDIKAKVS